MQQVKKSILVPVIFFSWFKYPVSLKELRRYLWQSELSMEQLVKLVSQTPQLIRQGERVVYGNLAESATVVDETVVQQFWQKLRRWRWLFAQVPFLRQVYVTNTLSYGNARQGSDIDLLIVGRAGRLWTCRAGLLLLMTWFGVRVRGISRHGKFSPEFWLAHDTLDISGLALPQDYYLSYWLADTVPIWPSGSDHQLLRANPWVKLDLPIAWRSPRMGNETSVRASYFARGLEWILAGRWGDRVEQVLRHRQQRIIEQTQRRLGVNPSVVMSDNVIKLHFNDRRAAVRDHIEQELNAILAED